MNNLDYRFGTLDLSTSEGTQVDLLRNERNLLVKKD
jgi:hypothetical protein